MQKEPLIDHWSIRRKYPLRWLLGLIILAALLSIVLQACSLVPVRKEKPVQGWMIDSADASLYRHVGTDSEDAMMILGNPEAEQFMCFDPASVKELILRATE